MEILSNKKELFLVDAVTEKTALINGKRKRLRKGNGTRLEKFGVTDGCTFIQIANSHFIVIAR